jgi:ABC-type multidrug transport system fused ATPase/permease subunit
VRGDATPPAAAVDAFSPAMADWGGGVARGVSAGVGPEAALGEKAILRAVSGSARASGVTALMGPSGAGKTSLLDCLVRGIRLLVALEYLNARVQGR